MRNVVVIAAVLSIGCSSPSERGEAPAGQRQPILAGVEDTTSSAVVALLVENEDGSPRGSCTGALLLPDLVLTAKHCVFADLVEKARCYDEKTGAPQTHPGRFAPLGPAHVKVTNAANARDVRPTIVGREVFASPEDRGGCGDDLALVSLSESVAGVTPLGLRIGAPPVIGEVFSAIGYGTDAGVLGTQLLRRARHDVSVEYVDEVPVVGEASPRIAGLEWVADEGPCLGDSGSPAIGADGLVLGVMAHGPGAKCTHMIYERIERHADWLRAATRKVAQASGEAIPAWARTPEDDVAEEQAPAAPAPASPSASSEPGSSGCSASARTTGTSGSAVAILGAALLLARRRRRALSLAALALAGCAPGTSGGEHTGKRSSAVLGGERSVDDAAVVMIRTLDAKGKVIALCTGTVIEPRVVLTAAHCVSPLVLGKDPSRFVVFFGDDATREASWKDAERTRKLDEVHVDPAYDGTRLGGHDLALLVATDALPAKPIPIRRAPLAASVVGRAVRVVGFGLTDAGDEDSYGVRYASDARVDALDDSFLTSDDAAHSFCRGDSGGPLLLDGELVGVASFHRGDGEDTTPCSSTAFAARVDTDLAFLDGVTGPLAAPDAGAPASDEVSVAEAAPPAPAPANGCAAAPGTTARWWPSLVAAFVALACARRRRACASDPLDDLRGGARG